MPRCYTILALAALAVTGASATGFYATTPKTGVVAVGASTPYLTCGPDLLAGASKIKVHWSNFTAMTGVTSFSVKLCYTADKIIERPWRKFVGEINKNKQCWQTAKLAKFLKQGIAFESSGELEIEVPMNTAASTYTIQMLSQNAAGNYLEWGDSVKTSCKITTTSYDNQPASLQGVQAFFCVFSILVLVVAYTYDRSKQA
eukprot:CAMPEP_0181358820 /NCGR_PEP_ID=MMETSP1106-20121128/5737_1 /TAXON_ID=81844 /ORGANISM="Mantoniella antarctica, Strain SL-175" /LENGTH=200 /DNA_ID=CAMNT_0023471853 /DNA_START=68 /DNA_END=670 /DNA_ORIENTATION=-